MRSTNIQQDSDEIEEALHRFLGRFFITFATLELNLSLRVGGEGNFHDKLERFYEMSITQYGDNELRFCEISAWYMAAESIRNLRNRLAHGRWGFQPHERSVVHVSGYPPGPQEERRFSLAELDSIVRDSELLTKELKKIRY